jgi:hypothetical protein
VFIASASFAENQALSITGETKCYNGLEVDAVGAASPGPNAPRLAGAAP